MKIVCLSLFCALVFPPFLHGADSDLPKFLQSGNDYVFRFAGKSPFQKLVQSPQDSASTKSRSAKSRRETVKVFTVVARAGGSWILVEHPKHPEDASKWNSKRLAMAILAPESVAAFKATSDGQNQLEKLRKQASLKIETARTWVNVDHLVTIRKASHDLSGYDPAIKQRIQEYEE